MNEKNVKKLEDQEERINLHSFETIKSMFDTMEGKVLEKKLYTLKNYLQELHSFNQRRMMRELLVAF